MVHFPKSAVDPPEKRLGIEPKVTLANRVRPLGVGIKEI